MTKTTYFFTNKFFLFLSVAILATLTIVAGCGSATSSQTMTQQKSAAADEQSGFDHSAYETLLKTYVDENGKVDYAGLQKNDRAKLDAYLKSLGEADVKSFKNEDEINAFYINAYNAFTIRDVLDDVYGKTTSVKKVDGFWDAKKHRIGGEDLTLDEIEKVSRNLKDPRMHFAVNCASTSCPKLQRFAFTGAKLQEQFEFITKDFLSDEKRGLRIDREKNKIWISMIFSWYAGDFDGDTSGFGFLKGYIKSKFTASTGKKFVKNNVPPEVMSFIEKSKPDVSFLEYDWTLNSQIPPGEVLKKK